MILLLLRMRWLAFVFLVATPFFGHAQDLALHSLPQAVQETVDAEKGDGVVKTSESYSWGDITIYRIEIDVDDVPTLELHVAENGKLLRSDRLQPEKDEDDAAEANY
jgi:hypothetical protein